MPTFNENLIVNGRIGVNVVNPFCNIEPETPWGDWMFLRQKRDVGGGGGFHIHNPWGNTNQSQGDLNRNRLEIAYRNSQGQDLWGQFVIHGPSGNVGIGTTLPTEKLHVNGKVLVSTLWAGLPGSKGQLVVSAANGNSITNIIDGGIWTGGFGTDGHVVLYNKNNAMTVHIDGSMGDIALLGADCAEEFTLKNSSYCEPGTVMILNDDETVSPSNTEFDKKVVGVISGAGRYKPAIIMDKQENNKNRVPIAVMGKVLCKVDSSYAKIERGDLLTTSPTLGHAMKAEDPIKTFGSVIGKALATAQEDLSMIPILVSLR